MGRTRTPSFILELEVSFSSSLLSGILGKPSVPGDRGLLDKKFNAANAIYNTVLNEGLRRLHKLEHDLSYKNVCLSYKEAVDANDEDSVKALGAEIGKYRSYYGYTEFGLHAYIAACKNHFNLLGIDECQKLASRAFKAVEKLRRGESRKVRFHHWYDDISVEGKSSKSTLKYNGNLTIQFGRGNVYPLVLKKKDDYAAEALTHTVKYVRLVRRAIRGKARYFAQLVMEGLPPKTKNLQYGKPDARVGLDEGTTTVAVVSRSEASLQELAPGLSTDEKRLRALNRAMDRSRRAMNPGNYNGDGTIRKGRKTWIKSNRYKKLEAKRREWFRVTAEKRRCAHNALANHIVALGCDIRVEDMRIQALAKKSKTSSVHKENGSPRSRKRFGKTITTRAPAMLISVIDRKLGYIGLHIRKVNTRTVKASQYDHKADAYHKKKLSERWHVFEDGTKVQRDLYSAFLIFNTEDDLQTINRQRCNRCYQSFKALHDAEVMRIRAQDNKILLWYVA